MKFVYAYRDSQNVRHDDVIIASSKDDAFKKVRALGRRPFFVDLAPGFWNRLQAIGKRGAAILILALALIGALIIVFRRGQPAELDYFDSSMRRYPLGDSALIDEGIRTGWANVFALQGDRFFASYAIPGVVPAVRDATESEIRKALTPEQTSPSVVALGQRTSSSVEQLDTSSIEARQVRAMVNGVKEELREYLAAGGTITAFCVRLKQREYEEVSCYQRATTEIETAVDRGADARSVTEIVNRNNIQLRQLGIRTIPMPVPSR